MQRIERRWDFEVQGTPESLWPHICDPSQMNRALGTAAMRFEGRRWNGGVRHDGIEVPWNWVMNQWLTCPRVHESGGAASTPRSTSSEDLQPLFCTSSVPYRSKVRPEPVGVRRWTVDEAE